MSKVSPNQPIVSADPKSARMNEIHKNSEDPCLHTKLMKPVYNDQPNIVSTTKGNEIFASTCPTPDSGRIHKLGCLPRYLKKETKATIELDFVTKCKKFKTAKRNLIDQQSTLKKYYEQLRVLKGRFKQLGGRELKLETLEIVEFTGGENYGDGDGDGDGDETETRLKSNFVDESKIDEIIFDSERELQKNREIFKVLLNKFISAKSDILTQITEIGKEEIEEKSNSIFTRIGNDFESVSIQQEKSSDFILQSLQKLKIPFLKETCGMHSSNDKTFDEKEKEIFDLKRNIQDLEVHSKILQSEIDVKNREIEYLNSNNSNSAQEEQDALNSKIASQEAIMHEYSAKLEQCAQDQEKYEMKIMQLNKVVAICEDQIEENLLKYETDLSESYNKYEELLKMLKKNNNAVMNNENYNASYDSNYDLVANQLSPDNEDVEILQFKISEREKKIQNLTELLNSESTKAKEFDNLALKYDKLRQRESCKSEEINQLKENLVSRTDTINDQIQIISELKKVLMIRDTVNKEYDKDADINGQKYKFEKQEKIIEKLENNKCRSNVLRNQLLDRISLLEKENEDMKSQIRKFHEEFTINRFIYDEQRRKKRLTEILVKQYQK